MTTYEDMFRRELDNFTGEFRNKLAANIRNGIGAECWRDIRDSLLIDYPKLRDCYSAHGLEHTLPIEQQSEKARLGRQFAGAMSSVRRDMYDVKPIKKPTHTIFDTNYFNSLPSNGQKWVSKTPITKIQEKPKQHISQHPMMTELAEVKPGEEISFIYMTRDEARDDQSKVAYFVKALGWYKSIQDGRRPYSTSISTHQTKQIDAWKLTIKRLDTSQPLPVVMQRG